VCNLGIVIHTGQAPRLAELTQILACGIRSHLRKAKHCSTLPCVILCRALAQTARLVEIGIEIRLALDNVIVEIQLPEGHQSCCRIYTTLDITQTWCINTLAVSDSTTSAIGVHNPTGNIITHTPIEVVIETHRSITLAIEDILSDATHKVVGHLGQTSPLEHLGLVGMAKFVYQSPHRANHIFIDYCCGPIPHTAGVYHLFADVIYVIDSCISCRCAIERIHISSTIQRTVAVNTLATESLVFVVALNLLLDIHNGIVDVQQILDTVGVFGVTQPSVLVVVCLGEVEQSALREHIEVGLGITTHSENLVCSAHIGLAQLDVAIDFGVHKVSCHLGNILILVGVAHNIHQTTHRGDNLVVALADGIVIFGGLDSCRSLLVYPIHDSHRHLLIVGIIHKDTDCISGFCHIHTCHIIQHSVGVGTENRSITIGVRVGTELTDTELAIIHTIEKLLGHRTIEWASESLNLVHCHALLEFRKRPIGKHSQRILDHCLLVECHLGHRGVGQVISIRACILRFGAGQYVELDIFNILQRLLEVVNRTLFTHTEVDSLQVLCFFIYVGYINLDLSPIATCAIDSEGRVLEEVDLVIRIDIQPETDFGTKVTILVTTPTRTNRIVESLGRRV